MAVKNKIIYAVITMLFIYIIIGVFAYFFGGPCATRLFDQGEKAAVAKEYKSAIRKFSAALQLELNSKDKDSTFISTLYNARGRAFFMRNRHEDAIADYRKAIDYNSQNAEAKSNLNTITNTSH